MTEHVQVGGLQVAKVLFDFVNNEAIPGTGLTADKFWAGADKVIHDLAPKNKALLAKRDDFQARIDTWHQTHAGQAHDPDLEDHYSSAPKRPTSTPGRSCRSRA